MITDDYMSEAVVYVVFWLICLFITIKFFLFSKNKNRSVLHSRLSISGFIIGGATALFLAFTFSLQSEVIGELNKEMTDPKNANLKDINQALLLAINSYFEIFKQVVTVFGSGIGASLLASGLVMKAQFGYDDHCDNTQIQNDSCQDIASSKEISLGKFSRVSKSVKAAFKNKI
ncbi:hypothetical protein [Vibrio parahaemolyticus]|uniref:hypothetical protein n=1 Tax=Vibrio parahaemolyticus TaxID=670 RepID=UPI0011232F1F|nr:hypothetical protein [Vibrio parahaemolyticus]